MKQKEPERELTPEEERVFRGCTFSTGTALLFILVILLAFLLHSCKTVEYIKVPEVHTDTCYVDRIQRDSIRIETVKYDSILIRENGDTITIERWHTEWRDRYRDRYIHDSVYIAQHDTVSVPYEVVKEVPAQINGWQRFRMQLGGITFWLILIGAGIGIFKTRTKWLSWLLKLLHKL